MSFALRPIRMSDAALILQARNSDAVRLFMCSQSGTEPYCLFLHGSAPTDVVGVTHSRARAAGSEWVRHDFAARIAGVTLEE